MKVHHTLIGAVALVLLYLGIASPSLSTYTLPQEVLPEPVVEQETVFSSITSSGFTQPTLTIPPHATLVVYNGDTQQQVISTSLDDATHTLNYQEQLQLQMPGSGTVVIATATGAQKIIIISAPIATAFLIKETGEYYQDMVLMGLQTAFVLLFLLVSARAILKGM